VLRVRLEKEKECSNVLLFFIIMIILGEFGRENYTLFLFSALYSMFDSMYDFNLRNGRKVVSAQQCADSLTLLSFILFLNIY